MSARHLERFYAIVGRLRTLPGQGKPLRSLPRGLPQRGVYFFFEPGENRSAERGVSRVVRVGTHAVSTGSNSKLRTRLKQHLGTREGGGNHRGSIFRLHVGAALLARDGLNIQSWGKGSSKSAGLVGYSAEAEEAHEQRVSAHLGSLSVCWVEVPDEPGPMSARSFIERNAIALLSNKLKPLDPPSSSWLGSTSPRMEIRESGLWNLNYVEDGCDPAFLDALDAHVSAMARAQRG